MRYGVMAVLGLATVVSLAACGGDGQASEGSAPATASTATPPAPGGPLTPDPGGKVITVEMETDAQGNNLFEPANVEARKGDVIRYMLVAGVHNANFLPDSNGARPNLPGQGPLLQLPGQTYDVKVTLDPGKYYFHCDPHALLGMTGHLTVVP